MAILAGVATNIETIKRFLKGSDSELQLVDATFADRNTLDIRLRNTGSRIASVKRIEIDVKKIWVFRQLGGAFAYTASSHTYTVRLPVRPFPYTIQSVLSQDIAAGATDRFQVSFGAEAYDQQTWTAFARRHLKWERPKITEEQAEQLVRSGAPSFIWHDGGKADPPPDWEGLRQTLRLQTEDPPFLLDRVVFDLLIKLIYNENSRKLAIGRILYDAQRSSGRLYTVSPAQLGERRRKMLEMPDGPDRRRAERLVELAERQNSFALEIGNAHGAIRFQAP